MNHQPKDSSKNADQNSDDEVVCDNCGEKFDSDGGDDEMAKLPCKCKLHRYSCLEKRNKDEKCTGCGHCICDDCMRLWRQVKRLQLKLNKTQKQNAALKAKIEEMSNPEKKRKN